MGHEKNWKTTALDSEYYLCITIWLWCTDTGLVLHDGLLASLANFHLSRGHMLTMLLLKQTEEEQNPSWFSCCFFSWKTGVRRCRGCGTKTCITDSIITFDVYSSGAAQQLALWLYWRGKDIRRQQGQFRPPFQLCTVPQPASVLTHTHLLTHPHSNYSFSVARIPNAHTPHRALSCRSVRVEKQRVVEQSVKMHMARKGKLLQRKVHEAKGQW